MADEIKTVTAADAPKDANTGNQAETVRPQFFYPTVAEFTGLVQFRQDAEARVKTGIEPNVIYWDRGAVRRIGSKVYADRLVQTRMFSHVSLGTLIGQPAELRPVKPGGEPVAPVPTSQPSNDEGEE